jgi:hypothetical protein
MIVNTAREDIGPSERLERLVLHYRRGVVMPTVTVTHLVLIEPTSLFSAATPSSMVQVRSANTIVSVGVPIEAKVRT